MNPNALAYQRLLELVTKISSTVSETQNQLNHLETELNRLIKVDDNIEYLNNINLIKKNNDNILKEINNSVIPTIKQNIV